jgi:hypothetical protein
MNVLAGALKNIHQPSAGFTPAIPVTQEGEIRRIVVQGQPRQSETCIIMEEKLGMVVHVCLPS